MMKEFQIFLALLLAAALLAGCGTPQPAAETPAPVAEETVVVTDVAGLLDALAPGAVIEIDAEQLALDRAPDYGFAYSTGSYTWMQTGPREYALVIRDVEGLTIRGRGMGATTLSTGSVYSDVLRFENCSALALEDLTFGHRGELVGCAGNVLDFTGCEDVTLRRCELFGCGVIAVNAYLSERVHLEGCTLRDCTMAALNVTCCTDFQARDCAILRCGKDSGLAALCAASCNGFALINSRVEDGQNTFLMDVMNSSSVCLLGCEAKGNRFSNALFSIYGYNVTVSGCALSDNGFGSCYGNGPWRAVTGSGQALTTFADFAHMELKAFSGEYVGPAAYVTPGDAWYEPYTTDGDVDYASPGDLSAPPPPAPAWEGERTEVHVKTVDELLDAIAPHTTVWLDAEEFDLSSASNYGGEGGAYYGWVDTFDGPALTLHDLDDFSLVGGSVGVTLVSAVPRYADVLYFMNCRSVSLSDMTLGHRIEPGDCAGDVLEFSLCSGIKVERCGLFGCGVTGINASTCQDLLVSETNIYDCSYLAAQLFNVQDALFTGCSVTNCGTDGYGFNGLSLISCSGVFYDRELLSDGDYIVADAG